MSSAARLFPDERFRVRAGLVMGILSIGMGVYSVAVVVALGLPEALALDFIPHTSLTAVGFGIFALLAVPRQPFNNSVWVAVWAGFISGVSNAGYTTGFVVAKANSAEADFAALVEMAPADVPAAAAILYSFVGLTLLAILLILCVGLLLFPSGELPSRRWRWVAWGSMVVAIVFFLALATEFRPSSTTPFGADSDEWTTGGRFIDELLLVAVAFSLVALFSATMRYRSSSGTTRQQFRWMGLGCGVFIAALLTILLMPGPFVAAVGDTNPQWLLTLVGIAAVLGAYAIAVGKYRLYDIDVVMSRTLVYGVLAVFIGGVYIAVAVLPWVVLGSEARSNFWLGILATVVVAVSFQPLRRRLEGLANRLVYGRRATPYEVLSTFAQGLSAVDPDVLTHVARSLAEGTTARAASIWIERGGKPQLIAAWPSLTDAEPVHDVTAPVIHDGEELGKVSLDIPPGQPFPLPDRRLLDQVAAGLGLAMRNLQLTESLRDRVDELSASRRRIVSVQDETRRKLERDLHDGAQQRLVALKIKLGIGSATAEKAGLDDVKAMLDEVRGDTDQTIEKVRDFARGIYPPLLEAEGLGRALTARVRGLSVPVTVDASGLGRYPKEQEATVYFCALEALQNALKHANASSIGLVLRDLGGELSFAIRDDGVGFEVEEVASNGLVNMSDRLEAIGGSLTIESAPGNGTTVRGSLPVPDLVRT